MKPAQSEPPLKFLFSVSMSEEKKLQMHFSQQKCGNIYLGTHKALQSPTRKFESVLSIASQGSYDKQNIAQLVQNLDELQQHLFVNYEPSSEGQVSPYFPQTTTHIHNAIFNKLNLLIQHDSKTKMCCLAALCQYLIHIMHYEVKPAVKLVEQCAAVDMGEHYLKQLSSE